MQAANGVNINWKRLLPLEVQESLYLKCAIHRYFTFLKQFNKIINGDNDNNNLNSHEMAQDGLYCSTDLENIRCFFCNFTTELDRDVCDRVNRQHESCPGDTTDNKPFPTSRNYKLESHRLYSLLLKEGKLPDFISLYCIAATGLFYLGKHDDDSCQCIFCGLEVKSWEMGDVPEDEHRKYNPECRFFSSPQNQENIKIGDEIMDFQSDAIIAQLNTSTNVIENEEMQDLQIYHEAPQEENFVQPLGPVGQIDDGDAGGAQNNGEN